MNKAINHVFTFQNSFTYLRSLTTAVYQCPMHSLIIIQSLISSKKHREQIKRGEIFVPFNSYFLPIIECYGYGHFIIRTTLLKHIISLKKSFDDIQILCKYVFIALSYFDISSLLVRKTYLLSLSCLFAYQFVYTKLCMIFHFY